MKRKAAELFGAAFGAEPTVCAAAPGRIEFIGNHTDYNCGTVLGAAIDRYVTVALRLRTDGRKRFCSASVANSIDLEGPDVIPQRGRDSWVNYPLGVWFHLPQFALTQPPGFDIAIVSDLPSGAGLSSSAALEVATALVFAAATGATSSKEIIAHLGRRAENDFVGVPCGILDQGTSVFGEKDHLVHIDCRVPAFSTIPLPPGLRFRVFNTHVKHSLVDSLYATRHSECAKAAAILDVECLADTDATALEAGRGRLDAVLFKRARHVIDEIARVAAVCDALALGDLAAVGKLLTESHRSSRDQFENSTPELDFLVDSLVSHPAVLGARLTGGGFGGAVMALTKEDFPAHAAKAIADSYAARFGDRPDMLELATGAGARII